VNERLVVDASVAVKWLVPEQDWAVARRLYETHSLIAPQLILAECANILWKKFRRTEITRDEAVQAAEKFVSLELDLEPLGRLTVPAVEIAAFLNHPAYDCYYLALAVVSDVPIVTTDDRLLRVLKERGGRELNALCRPLEYFES